MVNFFQKLGLGLKKSSVKITSGISDIFTKKKIDSQTLDELEELLKDITYEKTNTLESRD